MAIIKDGKLMNTESDNAYVEEWLSKLPKKRVMVKGTGETLLLPFAEMVTDEQLGTASARQ